MMTDRTTRIGDLTPNGRLHRTVKECKVFTADADNADLVEEQRVQYWIENAVYCGYLHAFSISEYNSENIKFLMAVEEFRDHLAADISIWEDKSWSKLDARLDIEGHVNVALRNRRASYLRVSEKSDGTEIDWDYLASNNLGEWRSTKLNQEAVIKHIRQIWEAFFGTTATHEICIDVGMRARTVFRLRHIRQYGMNAFDEATTDPIKTVERDLLPRFLSSQFYREMKARLKQVQTLPDADTFHIDPPRSSAVARMDVRSETLLEELEKIPLSEIVEDSIMYEALKRYLTSIFATELLLCARCVARYKELWSEHARSPAMSTSARIRSGPRSKALPPPPPGVADLAWKIYAYFIADNSAYEVALSHRRRRQILQGLAAPTADMFDRMQVYNVMGLKDHQLRFYVSDCFRELPLVIANEQNTRKPEEKVLGERRKTAACFSFIM